MACFTAPVVFDRGVCLGLGLFCARSIMQELMFRIRVPMVFVCCLETPVHCSSLIGFETGQPASTVVSLC